MQVGHVNLNIEQHLNIVPIKNVTLLNSVTKCMWILNGFVLNTDCSKLHCEHTFKGLPSTDIVSYCLLNSFQLIANYLMQSYSRRRMRSLFSWVCVRTSKTLIAIQRIDSNADTKRKKERNKKNLITNAISLLNYYLFQK